MTDASEIAQLREQVTRERAARIIRRELQRLAAASSAASTIDDVLAAILGGVNDVLGAHLATVAIPDGDHARFVHVADTPVEIQERWQTAPTDADLPLVRALQPGATWIELPDRSRFTEWPSLAEAAEGADVSAYYVVPLRARAGSHPIAALGIGFRDPTELEPFDRAVLAEVCELASDAIGRAKELHRMRDIAEALQGALLPARLPVVEGLWIRKMYEPCVDLVDVGGDWYDVIQLAEGAVALVVGDVAGHDVRSAAEMGKVRHVLGSQLLDHGDPAVALTNTDRYFCSIDDPTYATALAVVIDADRERGVLASAGHLPPLHVSDSGVSVLNVDPGPPVGSGLGGYRTLEFWLDPGDAVIGYTDGVVERKGLSIDECVSLLAASVSTSGARQPADLLRSLRSHLDHPERADDAAVLLAVRARSESAGVFADPIDVTP